MPVLGAAKVLYNPDPTLLPKRIFGEFLGAEKDGLGTEGSEPGTDSTKKRNNYNMGYNADMEKLYSSPRRPNRSVSKVEKSGDA